jgi:hypothetical protein
MLTGGLLGATIGWTEPAGTFNLYRGSRPSLAWSYDQTCFAPGVAGPVNDGQAPAAGTVFTYLLTRVTACGESIPGRDSVGAPIPNAAPCTP